MDTTWGEVAFLEYGKALKDRSQDGLIPVFGTNGPTGSCCAEPLYPREGVIVGRKGAYRGIHWSPEPFWVIDTAFFLVPDENRVYPKWAYYELLTRDINGMDSGSAIPSTSRPDFYAMPLSLPPLDEQRRIVGVLGALDDKIELNERLAGRCRGLADLAFQRAFPVVEGQELLGDHVRVLRGRSYTSEELRRFADSTRYAPSRIKRGGGWQREGLKPYNGDFKLDQVLAPGEMVVAHTDLTQAADVIGKPALVPNVAGYERLVASLDLAVVRPASDRVTNLFLYHLFLRDEFQAHAYGYANGSTVLHLAKEAIPEFQVTLPATGRAAALRRAADSAPRSRFAGRIRSRTISGCS